MKVAEVIIGGVPEGEVNPGVGLQTRFGGQPGTLGTIEFTCPRSCASTAGETKPPPPEIGAEGVTAFEAELAGPTPLELVAVIVNVYEVPLLRPVIVMGEEAPLAVTLPGLEVTV